ncbi:MAG: flagellar hook-length control protein FliK [Acidobacteria bacterium]|nr:flagellar hook-length control protein FliK [Acidobacteriota bacterium]
MKVNLPMNVSQTGANAPAKSAGQPGHEAIIPFSIQMSRILHRNDEKGGIGGGYSRSDYDESDDDATGSMSNASVHGIESDVSDRNDGDPQVNIDPEKEVGDRQGSSEVRMREGHSGTTSGSKTENADNFSKQYVQDKTERNGRTATETSASKEADTQTLSGPDGKPAHLQLKVEESDIESGKAGIRAASDSKLQNGRTQADFTKGIERGQRSEDSTQGGKAVGEISVSGDSGKFQRNFAESDFTSGRAAREASFAPSTQYADNGRTGAGISDDAGSNFTMDNLRSSLNASAEESGLKKAIQSFSTEHENAEPGALESENVFRKKSDPSGDKQTPVGDSIKHQDTVRKNGFFQVPEFAGNGTSTKTPAGNASSSGDNDESGNNSGRTATAKTFQVNGDISLAVAGKDANPVKGVHVSEPTGTSAHVSAGSTHVSASTTPLGTNTVKTVAPHSDEFLSRVTERIHFLIRDGGDAVRIRLHPDEFGHMEIRAESTARGMAVRISTETGSVKSILENNLHILQQNLQELGLKVDRIQVMLQDFFDSQSNAGHFSKSGHSSSGQNEKGSRRNFGGNENSPEDTIPDNADTAGFSQDGRFHTVA